jgi:ankyrin repeat protein
MSKSLVRAIEAGDINECKLLLETKEANIFDIDNEGWTYVHHASWFSSFEILEVLISRGGDVLINAKSNRGSTALMIASQNRRLASVWLLLAKGASTHYKNSYGATALLWASQNGHTKIVDCLNRWPLTMAIITFQELHIYKYLDFSSIVDLKDYIGT